MEGLRDLFYIMSMVLTISLVYLIYKDPGLFFAKRKSDKKNYNAADIIINKMSGSTSEEKEIVNQFINNAKNGYVLVSRDNLKKYNKEPWFEKEAIIVGELEDNTEDPAYFLPIKRI